MENLIFIAAPASLYLIAAIVRWHSIAQRARLRVTARPAPPSNHDRKPGMHKHP